MYDINTISTTPTWFEESDDFKISYFSPGSMTFAPTHLPPSVSRQLGTPVSS